MKRLSPVYVTALLLLIGGVLSACSSDAGMVAPTPVPTATSTPIPTPTAPPVTQYTSTRFGVTATLPGKEWEDVKDTSNGQMVGDIVVTQDKTRLFTVSTTRAFMPSTSAELYTFVKSFGEAAFSPPQQLSERSFHGYQAVRLEATMSKAGLPYDYHLVQNFFVAKDQIYFVGVGVKVSDWEEGGQEFADAILDSVRIK